MTKFDIVEFANDMLSSMAKVREEMKDSSPPKEEKEEQLVNERRD